ncbi:MAG: hypothetical protein AAF597_13315 [Bacteroidota bacterium]
MDLIWTLGLLAVGYFGYNWYTGLQQQVREGRKPDSLDEPEDSPDQFSGPAKRSDDDYIDYEEVDEE